MRPGPVRALSRRDTALFLGCVILSILLLLRPDWGQAVTTGVRRSVLVPFLWLQVGAERARTSRVSFDQLRLQRDSAAHAAEFLPALRAENVRLRRLLGLGDRLPGAYVAAEVLHQSLPTDGRTILLSAGARDGVEVFDPVVGVEGLIGVVRTVEPNHSVAMTWAHPEFRASAFTLPGTVFGVVAPALQVTGSEQLLQLRGVAIRDSVPDGTMVVTSGLGGVYPPGIPVGTIVGQASEETGWERIYILRPAASPQAASQVLILRHTRAADPGDAFRRDSTP